MSDNSTHLDSSRHIFVKLSGAYFIFPPTDNFVWYCSAVHFPTGELYGMRRVLIEEEIHFQKFLLEKGLPPRLEKGLPPRLEKGLPPQRPV